MHNITLALLIVYVSVSLQTVFLCFMKNTWATKYKKGLIAVHLVSCLLIILNLSPISFRGIWVERVLVLAFLLTGSGTFALYRKTLQPWKKIYFGFFFFYPLLAPLTFFIDRIFCALVLGPLIASLWLPEIRYSSQDIDVRSPVGIFAGPRIQLVEKGLITETNLGICNNGDVVSLDISAVQILSRESDSTKAIISSQGKEYPATFYR